MKAVFDTMDDGSIIKADNIRLMTLMSRFLNGSADRISRDDVRTIQESCGVSEEYALSVLIAAACGLDISDNPADRRLFGRYFSDMLIHVDEAEYRFDPYYRNIHVPNVRIGDCELTHMHIKPYEAFVLDDTVRHGDGRIMPVIGYLDEKLTYPAILENGRIWMTVTPLEIFTMRRAILGAHGRVLTFGLGLGYFAYMVSRKTEVTSVTIVDNNSSIIRLFNRYILNQFENKDKIAVIHGDAFKYAESCLSEARYDYVFCDLWHDVGDGMEMYHKTRKYESQHPNIDFSYWIEQSILCQMQLWED